VSIKFMSAAAAPFRPYRRSKVLQLILKFLSRFASADLAREACRFELFDKQVVLGHGHGSGLDDDLGLAVELVEAALGKGELRCLAVCAADLDLGIFYVGGRKSILADRDVLAGDSEDLDVGAAEGPGANLEGRSRRQNVDVGDVLAGLVVEGLDSTIAEMGDRLGLVLAVSRDFEGDISLLGTCALDSASDRRGRADLGDDSCGLAVAVVLGIDIHILRIDVPGVSLGGGLIRGAAGSREDGSRHAHGQDTGKNSCHHLLCDSHSCIFLLSSIFIENPPRGAGTYRFHSTVCGGSVLRIFAGDLFGSDPFLGGIPGISLSNIRLYSICCRSGRSTCRICRCLRPRG